eukprot:evm.model.scf_1215EXC.4 EVM.evm.TU.scf_1215EXC.4   scf_1215EXC:23316-26178(-)
MSFAGQWDESSSCSGYQQEGSLKDWASEQSCGDFRSQKGMPVPLADPSGGPCTDTGSKELANGHPQDPGTGAMLLSRGLPPGQAFGAVDSESQGHKATANEQLAALGGALRIEDLSAQPWGNSRTRKGACSPVEETLEQPRVHSKSQREGKKASPVPRMGDTARRRLGQLHQEIVEFANECFPSKDELHLLERGLKQLENVVSEVFPKSKTVLFGSQGLSGGPCTCACVEVGHEAWFKNIRACGYHHGREKWCSGGGIDSELRVGDACCPAFGGRPQSLPQEARHESIA